MSTRGISRRDAAAGGVAMLVLAAAAAGQPKAAEQDGELIKLCHEFKRLNQETDRLGLMGDDLPFADPERAALDAKIRPMVDRIHAMRGEISDIPARTPEGVLAKAKVALMDLVPGEQWPDDNSQWLAISVLDDLLRRAGA